MMLAGFIAIIVVPVIILTMAITLIGIPLALLVAVLFAIALLVSKVFVSIWAGRYLLDRLNANKEDKMYINILVGVPVAGLLFAIPFLGGLAGFFGGIWALGAMIGSRKVTGKAK